MFPPSSNVTTYTQEELDNRFLKAMQTANRNALLNVYIDHCKMHLASENYEDAMFNLLKALSVMEFADDHTLKLETLNLCLSLVSFLHEYDDFKFLIEANLAIENETNYDIVSNSYFLLSMILLQKDDFDNAYLYAKMAFYFAKKLPEDQQLLYFCNAQLQLAFIALITKRSDEVDHYINSFNWQLENCQTKREYTLIQTVHFAKECLVSNFNFSIFEELKIQISNSTVKFYPTYLAIVLQKMFAYHEHQVRSYVNDWANELKKSNAFSINLFKENHKTFLNRNFINTELYFEKAEQLFVKAREQGECLYLIHFKASHSSRIFVEHLLYKDPHIEHIFHRYLDTSLVIAFEGKYKPYFDQLFEEYKGHYHIFNQVASQPHHHRFFDLHNLQFLKENH